MMVIVSSARVVGPDNQQLLCFLFVCLLVWLFACLLVQSLAWLVFISPSSLIIHLRDLTRKTGIFEILPVTSSYRFEIWDSFRMLFTKKVVPPIEFHISEILFFWEA